MPPKKSKEPKKAKKKEPKKTSSAKSPKPKKKSKKQLKKEAKAKKEAARLQALAEEEARVKAEEEAEARRQEQAERDAEQARRRARADEEARMRGSREYRLQKRAAEKERKRLERELKILHAHRDYFELTVLEGKLFGAHPFHLSCRVATGPGAALTQTETIVAGGHGSGCCNPVWGDWSIAANDWSGETMMVESGNAFRMRLAPEIKVELVDALTGKAVLDGKLRVADHGPFLSREPLDWVN
eukprot:SAG31_NODE_9371_length_1289_cov_1.240336_2_plen_242_part_01